jgi:hypothetical protein
MAFKTFSDIYSFYVFFQILSPPRHIFSHKSPILHHADSTYEIEGIPQALSIQRKISSKAFQSISIEFLEHSFDQNAFELQRGAGRMLRNRITRTLSECQGALRLM